MKTLKQWIDAQQSFSLRVENDKPDWLVVPWGRHRDSNCLQESNFHTTVATLGGEGDTLEVLRFGHWAVGWTELILVHPSHAPAVEALAKRLDQYPVLDENDLSEREQEAADQTWRNCFDARERIEYIRAHRNQFEFHNLQDMLSCVRGKYFAGYASELIY